MTHFYLGTHEVHWLARLGHTLWQGRRLDRSGGGR